MAAAIMLRQEGEYKSMKGRELERLKNEFDKYCEQMGIVDKPRLVLNKRVERKDRRISRLLRKANRRTDMVFMK